MMKHTLYKDDSDGSDSSGHSYSSNSNDEDGSGDDNIETQEGLANYPIHRKEHHHRETIWTLGESKRAVGEWLEETKILRDQI